MFFFLMNCTITPRCNAAPSCGACAIANLIFDECSHAAKIGQNCIYNTNSMVKSKAILLLNIHLNFTVQNAIEEMRDIL